jgi:hypothetical protein
MLAHTPGATDGPGGRSAHIHKAFTGTAQPPSLRVRFKGEGCEKSRCAHLVRVRRERDRVALVRGCSRARSADVSGRGDAAHSFRLGRSGMSVDCQRQRAAHDEANEQGGTDQREDEDAGVIGSRARRLKSQLNWQRLTTWSGQRALGKGEPVGRASAYSTCRGEWTTAKSVSNRTLRSSHSDQFSM